MNIYLFSFAIAFLSQSSLAASPNNLKQYSLLKKLDGLYKLVKNDGCEFTLNFKGNQNFQIKSSVIKAADKYGRRMGDTEIRFSQQTGPVFANSSLYAFNRWARRKWSKTVFYTSTTKMSKNGKFLSNKNSIYVLASGGMYGRQEFQWNSDRSSFKYKYVRGRITPTAVSFDTKEGVQSCKFKRVR